MWWTAGLKKDPARLLYMTKRHVSRKDTIWTTTGIEEDSAKSLSHCQVVVPGLSYHSL